MVIHRFAKSDNFMERTALRSPGSVSDCALRRIWTVGAGFPIGKSDDGVACGERTFT